MEKLKLDLACGNNKNTDGFKGVDIVETASTDYVFDLLKFPWPFEDNSVDEVHCSHFIEHIPHDIHNPNDTRDGFIQFIDEVYRILKPGAKATMLAPYYTSIRAYGDPTHVRAICDWTFYYFNRSWIEANKLEHYGIKSNFEVRHSYFVTNDLTLKSDEVRDNAFIHYWNTADDIIFELKKI